MADKAVPATHPFDPDVVRRAPHVPRAPRGPRSDPLALSTQAMLLGRILDLSLTGARSRREEEREAY
jgi:hypothetical protein